MTNQVAIIILQYGNAEATIDCINSVELYNTYPVKYIIVDNASPHITDCEKIENFLYEKFDQECAVCNEGQLTRNVLLKATLLKSAVNDGYARGNNKGLNLAYDDPEIDIVLVLNNDTLFVEDIIPKLVDDVKTLPNCAFVTPLLYKKNLNGIDMNCARKRMRFSSIILNNLLVFRYTRFIKSLPITPSTSIKEVELISGSCMLCQKEVFKKLGFFDTHTFLYYEEDILSEKNKTLHLVNYVDTNLKCIHLGASTTKQTNSLKIVKIGFKSQYYYISKYHKFSWIKLPLLKASQLWVIGILSFNKFLRWKR